MKAKLIKTGNHYLLRDSKGETLAISGGNTKGRMLSLKNCQAIERGYDLDQEMCKLVDKKAEQNNQIDLNAYGQGCLDAFKKALEILGDDIFEWLAKKDYLSDDKNILKEEYNQQTEWDVEIVEQCLDPTCDGVNRKGECITTGKPKLDADGCLILKRI